MANHCTCPKKLSCTSPDDLTPLEWSNIMNATIEWIMQVVYFIRLSEILIESDPYPERPKLSNSIKCMFLRHSSYKLDIDMSELDVWLRLNNVYFFGQGNCSYTIRNRKTIHVIKGRLTSSNSGNPDDLIRKSTLL